MNRSLAVVLVSGGMDSCVTAAIAAQSHETAFLHLNYGQRTENRELRAFESIAGHFNVPPERRLVCTVDHLRQIGGSSLTDPGIAVSQADLANTGVPTSYVPFRNAHLLSLAVSWGEVLGAEAIYIGAVEEDSSGYPDCRQAFFDAFNRVIQVGTKPNSGLEIRTPIIGLKKYEIIRKGIELRAPLELTWSCYQNDEIACGMCDSCALRLRGFQMAGFADPIDYVTRPHYT